MTPELAHFLESIFAKNSGFAMVDYSRTAHSAFCSMSDQKVIVPKLNRDSILSRQEKDSSPDSSGLGKRVEQKKVGVN